MTGKSIYGRRGKILRLLPLAPALVVSASCQAFPELQIGTGPRSAQSLAEAGSARPGRAPADRAAIDILQHGESAQSQALAQSPPVSPLANATPEEIAALLPERPVQAILPPQPLPQFIDTVFGQVLQVPYYTGPSVAVRRDFVSLRGPVAMSNRAFFAMVQMALRDYGLTVQIEAGAVRIVEDQVLLSQAPLFIRSRAMPETPEPSRPVIQFFELSALDVNSVMGLLNETYPRRGNVRFTPREDMNVLVISGNARDVASAAAVVNRIDQPRFAQGEIARVSPVYWAASGLTQAVSDVMATEGYRIATEAQAGAVLFLPIPFSNDLFVFSNDPAAFERALYWIDQLDRPAALGDAEGAFIYTAQNMSAAELGGLLSEQPGELRAAGAAAVSPRVGAVAGPPPRATAGAVEAFGGRVTVDAGGNRLIFRGTASQFARARALLEELDTPVQQVLVEVTIAEVTLTDETRFGVEWFLQQTIGSASVGIDTRGGSSPEDGGLGATYSRAFSRGSVQAALNAIATNSNLNILSTPRLVARSGSEAQILVGTDVPIITSQRAAESQTGGDTDILQSVQYRQTGVILNMRPVVYGGDRVDIEIVQEVSSQQPNETSDIDSPIILNRAVSTQLSLREGMTGVIGGMIQDSYTRGQTGVPWLKDVPGLGVAFRSDSVSGTKVELLILITPYIIRNEEQMADAALAYADDLNRLMRRRGPQTYTLSPWRRPFQGARYHGAAAPVAPPVPPIVVIDDKPKDRAVAPPQADIAPETEAAPADAPSEAAPPAEAPGAPADIAPPSSATPHALPAKPARREARGPKPPHA